MSAPISKQPIADPFDDFDLVCDFPHSAGTFSELRRYVRAIHEFLPHASAQQAIRVGARLKQEDDSVRVGELAYELETINADSQVSLPRLIWGGVLVTVFGAYESSVIQTIRHWQKTTGHPEAFEKIGRRDILKVAKDYSDRHIGVALFEGEGLHHIVTELKSFRKSFAHGSGLLSDLPADLVAAIKRQKHPGVSMAVEDGKWVANARSAAFYLLNIEKASATFGSAVLGKCLAHRHHTLITAQ